MTLLPFTISGKYGMIPNVIIAIVLVFSLASCSFDRKIARETTVFHLQKPGLHLDGKTEHVADDKNQRS